MDSHVVTQADESDIGQHKPPRKHKANRPRYRDLIRRTAFGVNFAVVAVENQSLTHYLMPLRAMDYDIRGLILSDTLKTK